MWRRYQRAISTCCVLAGIVAAILLRPSSLRPSSKLIATPAATLSVRPLPTWDVANSPAPVTSATASSRRMFDTVKPPHHHSAVVVPDAVSTRPRCLQSPIASHGGNLSKYYLAGQTVMRTDTTNCVRGDACEYTYGAGASMRTIGLDPAWTQSLPCIGSDVALVGACEIRWPSDAPLVWRGCLPTDVATVTTGTADEPTPVIITLDGSPLVIPYTITIPTIEVGQNEITIMASGDDTRVRVFLDTYAGWGSGELWTTTTTEMTSTLLIVSMTAECTDCVLIFNPSDVDAVWTIHQVTVRPTSRSVRTLHLPPVPGTDVAYPTETIAAWDIATAFTLGPSLQLWELVPTETATIDDPALNIVLQFTFLLSAYYGASVLAVNGLEITDLPANLLDTKCPFSVTGCAPLVGRLDLQAVPGSVPSDITSATTVTGLSLLVTVVPSTAIKKVAGWVAPTTLESPYSIGSLLPFIITQGPIATAAAIYYYTHAVPLGADITLVVEATGACVLVGVGMIPTDIFGLSNLAADTPTTIRIAAADVAEYRFTQFEVHGTGQVNLVQLQISWTSDDDTTVHAVLDPSATSLPGSDITIPAVFTLISTPYSQQTTTFQVGADPVVSITTVQPTKSTWSPYWVVSQVNGTWLPATAWIQATSAVQLVGGSWQPYVPMTASTCCAYPSEAFWTSCAAETTTWAPSERPTPMSINPDRPDWDAVLAPRVPPEFWLPVTALDPSNVYAPDGGCVITTYTVAEGAMVSRLATTDDAKRLPRLGPVAVTGVTTWLVHQPQSLEDILAHALSAGVTASTIQFIYALNMQAAVLFPIIQWTLQGITLAQAANATYLLPAQTWLAVADEPA